MKNEKIYHYYDLDNERRTLNLDDHTQIVRIRDDHCKFCGCRMAVFATLNERLDVSKLPEPDHLRRDVLLIGL